MTAVSQSSPPEAFDAENADNFEDIEKQFAVKAVQHLEIYWNLLEKRKGSSLKLTKIDDEIYDDLIATLPNYEKPEVLNEDEMKSPGGKKVWREFMMKYEKKVDDYSFGSLLRADCKKEYSEENTIFVPRMQFLAIEIARNKHGLNDWVYDNAQKV